MVFGAIDCVLHSLRPPQLPSLAAGLLRLRSLRLQTIFNGYVLALRRHPSCVGVLARFTPLLTRNLRLHFRLVNAGALLSELQSPLRHTVSHVPPTHRGSCRLHSRPSAFAPTPSPRCAVRRCPDATTADGQPLMSASSGLRLTARRGRLTLKPQADFRDSLSLHKFHDTPLCRSLQAANAPLAVLPPSRATSSSPPIATFNPST